MASLPSISATSTRWNIILHLSICLKNLSPSPIISIRGGGTPLYVIDGVVRGEVDFRNLSPDDIEYIRQQFGPAYGVSIEQRDGGGIRVKIKVPGGKADAESSNCR